MSLLEVLVAVAIISVLTGLTLVSSRLISESRKQATAKQQLSLLAAAINKYAEFWPPWKVVNGATEFRIAEKGWPDFLPGRLFPTGTVPPGNPSYSAVNNFNNIGPVLTLPLQEWDMATLNHDLLSANACLVYALTSRAGKGPHMPQDHPNLLDLRTYKGGIPEPLYPSVGGASAESRKIIMDPWGVPIRYFWVYRDVEPTATIRAYTGYLPVDYGAFTALNGFAGSISDPAFHQTDANSTPKVAVGYVLESAGPNMKFGNIWKVSPTPAEIEDASDNITLKP
jgi:type II secretory pathway pseudopilin PulG